MDLKYYLNLFKEWLWLMLLAGIVAGAIGYVATPQVYEANVLISVGGYIQSPNPDRVEVGTAVELAQAYAVVAKTRGVLQAASDAINSPLSGAQIKGIVQTRVVPDTALLEISVTYNDPVVAADMAYAIAEQLIYLSPTDPRLGSSASRQLPSNYLTIIEGPRPAPRGPSPAISGISAALIGATLVAGGVLLMDYLSDDIKSAEEASQLLALPVLGSIPKFPRVPGGGEAKLRIDLNGDFVSERYRTLRTVFLHSINQQAKQAYVITSASSGEGKSVTAANLAATIAVTDVNVLLIDADFRRPTLHELFGLRNRNGLTSLLASEPPTSHQACTLREISDVVGEVVQDTNIPRLRVITSGTHAPASPALLASSRTQAWMEALLSATDVDIILLDTPPALVMTDALEMGVRSGAGIILVLQAGKTSQAAALEVKHQCDYLNLKMQGVILNRVHMDGRAYKAYYDNSY